MVERNVAKFEVGQYVLLQCSSEPPDKLSAPYRGAMEIVAINRSDIVKVRDLTTNKVSSGHTVGCEFFSGTRLKCPRKRSLLSSVELNEYYDVKIVAHKEKSKNWKFKERVLVEDSWL